MRRLPKKKADLFHLVLVTLGTALLSLAHRAPSLSCTAAARTALRCYGNHIPAKKEPWRQRPMPVTVCRATRGEKAASYAKQAQSFDRPKRQIEREDVDFIFSRSGGPGGQNVNKVETRVTARFDVESAHFLPDWVKQKLQKQQANRLIGKSVIQISVQEQRTQIDNIRIAVKKLQEMIENASYIPPPPDKEKFKKMKRVMRNADKKRVEDKRRKSQMRRLKEELR